MSESPPIEWHSSSCWIASFDILGFKNQIDVDGNTCEADFVREDYEAVLRILECWKKVAPSGKGNYLWFSDTFILIADDDSAASYAWIELGAKEFIKECLHALVPIRGAISVGSIIRSQDDRALLGKAFLDAHRFGEDQDWLGLLLTPTAIEKVRSYGYEPTKGDFVAWSEIPMRALKGSDVLAYRLQSGRDSSETPLLLAPLQSLLQSAPEDSREKYERTIKFITEHHRRTEP